MHSFADGFNSYYCVKHLNFENFTKKISLTLVYLGCLKSQ